jgi:hypothetical protein
MLLTFRDRRTSLSCAWESYALLRDNVQHYIERGSPSDRFSALHAIEDAVDGSSTVVDSGTLRGEVLSAWSVLWKVPLAQAAVSLRTRAIMTRCEQLPLVRGTVRARDVGWDLPICTAPSEHVAEAAQAFVEVVLTLTAATAEGEEIEVMCS